MSISYAGRPMRAVDNGWADSSATVFAPGATAAGLVLPGLQRKAWHGGPAYYNSLYNPQILAESAVFPVFEFYLSVNDDGDADAEAAFGVMGGVRVTAGTNLQTLRDTGLYAFPSGPGSEYSGTVGTETTGWFISDETDLDNGPGWGATGGAGGGTQGYYQQQLYSLDCPSDGRSRFASYSVGGLLYFETPGQAAVFVNAGDTLTESPIPPDNWPQHTIMADLYWYAGVVSSAFSNAEFRGLPAALNGRSQNYGWTLDGLSALQGTGLYNVGPKPLWSIIETGHPYIDGTFMLPAQFNGACWNSVIHEAAGICLFVHDFINTLDPTWASGTQYAQYVNVIYEGLNYCAAYGTPVMGTIPPDDSAWQSCVTGVTGLRSNDLATGMSTQIPATVAAIQALAPVISTQTITWIFNTQLDTMMKAPGDGNVYIFAMQSLLYSSGTYALTLPPGISGATATVLNESRTINITDGVFSDTFAGEYTVHIYQIAIA
jgi:hypothetical protein